ncbi:ABC transporter ATP-binding protein, partial [Micromonospora sp. CPCC 205371]|nr:ABC transporter ATP-binding protein [Micromonospora sp. CPCC 205371]
QRLRDARAGRTTVLISTSPLLLGGADLVAHVREGRVVATGRHVGVPPSPPTRGRRAAGPPDIADDAERGGVRR